MGPLPAIQLERMSPRARVYVGIAAVRHLLVGAACGFIPQAFTSGSYDSIKEAMPGPTSSALLLWALVLAAVGVVCAIPVFNGNDRVARFGLLLSVVVTGAWVGGFIAAIVAGTSAGPTGLIVWVAITAKDLTMLDDPLRTPFEDLARQVVARPRMGT